MTDSDLPLAAEADGACLLSVRLTPKASRARIEGIERDADGRPWLKVSVTAVPEAGKANAALVALLAKAWRLPKSTVSVTAGAAARRKTVRIAAGTTTPEALAAHLRDVPAR
jgi:uncharacterized protein (TIGR00251 family)